MSHSQQSVQTANWVAGLFLLSVALQRLAVPGTPISLLLPILFIWTICALKKKIVALDSYRFTWWCLAAGFTGIASLLQIVTTPAPITSPPSWLLFVVSWLPFVVAVEGERARALKLVLDKVTSISLALAALCILMMATQLMGLAFTDYIAELLPRPFLLADFNTTYPLQYGSSILKSNGWIGLEASFASFQLGVGIICALMSRKSPLVVLLLVVGLFTTASGSGIIVAALGITLLAFRSPVEFLKRYWPLGALVTILIAATPYGQVIAQRSGEVGTSRSSASLRAVLPYVELWPNWVSSLGSVVLGNGPGSSQRLIGASGVEGTIVTIPIKLFYDFGLIAGGIFAGFLIYCYLDSSIPALPAALFVSIWTVQPGATVLVLSIPVLLLVTVWSPAYSHYPATTSTAEQFLVEPTNTTTSDTSSEMQAVRSEGMGSQ